MSKVTDRTIKELIVTSSEVVEILNISQARLSQLVKAKKLVPIKKNIFLLDDVEKRKSIQEGLRAKYYRAPKK
ncbi:hypothetical protein [Desulfitobacterium hafniense]|uniref:hypothetical protein n=1 Tax=Desulfitobacterium hafniense TaxID=49338 RepID=UPI002B21D02D|nr:hypothetical protein [Desulfitobacterium hafniense]